MSWFPRKMISPTKQDMQRIYKNNSLGFDKRRSTVDNIRREQKDRERDFLNSRQEVLFSSILSDVNPSVCNQSDQMFHKTRYSGNLIIDTIITKVHALSLDTSEINPTKHFLMDPTGQPSLATWGRTTWLMQSVSYHNEWVRCQVGGHYSNLSTLTFHSCRLAGSLKDEGWRSPRRMKCCRLDVGGSWSL